MRYFIELSFNGKKFHGWQRQPDVISVQEVIENAISKIIRKNISIVGAGRTDAGVHAKQIFAHCNVEVQIDTEKIKNKLNAFLPDSICIIQLFEVNKDAHARFDAINRSYQYHICEGKNPFLTETTWQIKTKKLDVPLMNQAASLLLNYTNFKCFSKTKTDVHTYNCTVTEARWLRDENQLTFHITANRFLRNMVRAIVGTLYEVGIHKISIAAFEEIIQSQDRSKAGISVPAQGLFLTNVTYPSNLR